MRKNFHKFTGRANLVTVTPVSVVDAGELENIYDDTQQLQCDLGMCVSPVTHKPAAQKSWAS